jgi:hypothetical protein
MARGGGLPGLCLGFLSKLQPTLGHFHHADAILLQRHAICDLDAGRRLASKLCRFFLPFHDWA